MSDTLDSLRAQNAEQAAEIERLKRERDIAIGERVARSKLIRRLRNAFVDIRDNLDDEGDRVFFGSTNQADDFREIVEKLEELNWADILRDAQNVDPFETARAAVARAEAAEARCAELCQPFVNADDEDWNFILDFLPDDGPGRFWKCVLIGAKAALGAKP